MEKVFIAKAVNVSGVETSFLLGEFFEKVFIKESTTHFCPSDLPSQFLEWILPQIKEANENGDGLFISSQLFLINEDGKIYSFDKDNYNVVYITCNGTTIERIYLPEWPKDWTMFWIDFFESNPELMNLAEKYNKV